MGIPFTVSGLQMCPLDIDSRFGVNHRLNTIRCLELYGVGCQMVLGRVGQTS